MSNFIHDSDCATHNEPALPAGPCDCDAGKMALIEALRPFAWYFDVNDCKDRDDHSDAIEVPIRDLRAAFDVFNALGLAVQPIPDPVGNAVTPTSSLSGDGK